MGFLANRARPRVPSGLKTLAAGTRQRAGCSWPCREAALSSTIRGCGNCSFGQAIRLWTILSKIFRRLPGDAGSQTAPTLVSLAVPFVRVWKVASSNSRAGTAFGSSKESYGINRCNKTRTRGLPRKSAGKPSRGRCVNIQSTGSRVVDRSLGHSYYRRTNGESRVTLFLEKMPANLLLDALRQKINCLEEAPRRFSRTIPVADAIDRCLPHGGLSAGCIHEVKGSSLANAIAFSAILSSRLAGDQGNILYIASDRSLYPLGLLTYGVKLDQLLHISTRRSQDLAWAAMEALRCPQVSAVIALMNGLDLTESHRLQLAA